MVVQACTTLGSSLALAETPRVFLSEALPGWVNAENHIQLPLTMGGPCTDIGVHRDDRKGLADWLSRHTRFFASEAPAFDLYPNEAVYRSVVQPDWLRKARMRIDQTIEEYMPAVSASKRLGPVFSLLASDWPEIRETLSSLLYKGEGAAPPDGFYLTAQDLSLFGKEADPDADLFSLLRLFDTAAHVTALLKSNMIDRIVIEGETGPKELYDAASDPSEPYVEVFDGSGRKILLRKSELRPACVYEPDAEGNIDPLLARPADIHEAYTVFQDNLVRHNAFLTGAYLLAHFRIGDDEAKKLCERIAPHRLEDLFPSTAPDIVRLHLMSTGRWNTNVLNDRPEEAVPMRLLTRTLMRIGSFS